MSPVTDKYIDYAYGQRRKLRDGSLDFPYCNSLDFIDSQSTRIGDLSHRRKASYGIPLHQRVADSAARSVAESCGYSVHSLSRENCNPAESDGSIGGRTRDLCFGRSWVSLGKNGESTHSAQLHIRGWVRTGNSIGGQPYITIFFGRPSPADTWHEVGDE